MRTLTTTTGACPRDSTPLEAHDIRGLRCRKCTACSGLFVDAKALLGMIPAGSPARVDQLPDSAVACPACAVTMRMRVHRGVELDVCPGCQSVWLDAGEWERIAKPSSRGSQFGRTAVMSGAAAAAGAAAMSASASAKTVATTPGASESLGSQIASGVADVAADVAIDGAVEVVFSFIGEALGSIF